MENKTRFSIGKVGKWKWIVPMDGNAFYSASRARRGEILFNGSHMLKTRAPLPFFETMGPDVIEENPQRSRRVSGIIKIIISSLRIRAGNK